MCKSQALLSVSQRSITHFPLQLLCSQSAQQRLTVWIEDRISTQLSRLTSGWATESFIEPVEKRDDKERQAKLQLDKEAEQHQPQQHFEQSNAWEDQLSWGQPSSQSTVQKPVTAVLQKRHSRRFSGVSNILAPHRLQRVSASDNRLIYMQSINQDLILEFLQHREIGHILMFWLIKTTILITSDYT